MKKSILIITILTLCLPLVDFAQGCMTPKKDGISIIGFLQPEWNYTFLGENDEGVNLSTSSFNFRRARIGVAGAIPYDFSYYVLVELSPTQGGPQLCDAFVTYDRFGPYLKASLGQYKAPFSRESLQPCNGLYTINRAKVVEELGTPLRDIGLMLSGGTGSKKIFGLENENIVAYSFAIMNGTGMNSLDDNLNKDYIGRLVLNPWKLLSFGANYRFGKQENPDSTITKKDERSRWGVDVEMHYSNFILQAEYIYGTDKGSKLVGGGCGTEPTVVAGDFKSDGYYLMAIYTTPWKLQPVIKYETYDPDKDKEDYEKDSYRSSTVTFGLNYYPNDWARVQINYLYKVEGSSSSDINYYNEYPNDMFIIQVQAKIE
jgi:phosphate-selective porin OprO/OprP